MERKLYYETITDGSRGCVFASTVSDATPAQIKKAQKEFAKGKCPHNIVYDVEGWPYDIRHCGTCGETLGLI